MEATDAEEQERLILRRRRDEDEGHNFGPCNFCQNLIQSFLKCLGLERDSSAAPAPPPPPYEDDDPEEGGGMIGVRIPASRAARKKPSRPPVNSGRGGSIN